MTNKKYVSALVLSKLLNTSRSSIYRMADAEIIPSIRVGSKLGGRRFNIDEVMQALGGNKNISEVS